MQANQENPRFLTPERKTRPTKATATGIINKFGLNTQSAHSPATIKSAISHETTSKHKANSVTNEQLLESRVAALRIYLIQSSKVSKKAINRIFGWDGEAEKEKDGVNQEHKLLKELGNRLQSVLKESSQQGTEAIKESRFYNEVEPQSAIPNYRSSTPVNSYFITDLKHSQQQNTPNTSNISFPSQLKRNIEQYIVYQPVKRSPGKHPHSSNITKLNEKEVNPSSEPSQTHFNDELLNIEQTKNLKKYFTVCLNTCIEENDEKFAAALRYVQSLTDRMKDIEKIQKKIDHLRFEKEVRIQEAMEKGRNVSIAGPNVGGEQEQEDLISEAPTPKQGLQLIRSLQPRQHQLHLSLEPVDPQQDNNFMALRQENRLLLEQNQSLKLRYEKEIELHFRDNTNNQELLQSLQNLQSENTYLKEEYRSRRPHVKGHP